MTRMQGLEGANVKLSCVLLQVVFQEKFYSFGPGIGASICDFKVAADRNLEFLA